MEAALAAVQLDVQKAEMQKIIDDIDNENLAEATELIKTLLEGEGEND